MTTELKDNGGDPRSPINGQLRGLFFLSQNYASGELPSFSYFGPRRIQIEADELFRTAPNLYFADFYCMGGHKHYVIVVMTKPGSTADNFCRLHLVPLDSKNNPFFYSSNGKMYSLNAEYFEVEVFYTENLNITELQARKKAIMTTVEPVGQGHSTPGGKQKGRCCSICNVRVNIFGAKAISISDNSVNAIFVDI